MLPLDLTVTQRQDLLRALRGHHDMRAKLSILDLDGNYLSPLSHRLLSGQITVDSKADVSRVLTVTVSDPLASLTFDSDSPDDGAIYADRMLRAEYGVNVPELGWVDVPVFTGPVSKMDRQADVVSLEAQGKEVLAMGASWRPMTFRRNSRKSDVIRDVLTERAGEALLDIPRMPDRLGRDLSLGRLDQPWPLCQRLARSMGMQLFYDGRGVCRLRTAPERAQVVFRDRTGGTVQSDPQISYQTEGLRNTVWVKGGVPKGRKKAVQTVVKAQRNHPLSPWRLGRTTNGVLRPFHLVEVVEAGQIRSEREAERLGERTLKRFLRQAIDVSFDSWPTNPLLEPQDVSALETENMAMEFTVQQFTIPLVASDVQSIGYIRRINTKRQRQMRRNRP